LADAEAATVHAHLADCAECRSWSATPLAETQPMPAGALPTPTDPHRQTQPALAVATAQATPIPQELIDHPRYHILRPIGAGGMGQVYLAEHRVMERQVALKVIRRALTDEPAAVARFQQEVKAAARLTHPNIVTAFDAEHVEDLHFLVMEYVDGTDLSRLVGERGPLSPEEACDYIRQAASGLHHAHERGMVHRDIKPHNLMLTKDGVIKVLDFGLARLALGAKSGSSLTGPGAVMGTPDFMAPEQAMNSKTVDRRADLYSLGCTLYFLLSGRPPFEGESAMEKLFAHIEKPAKPLTELRGDLTPGLNDLVERMMAKSPERRPATAAEVVEALTPFTAAHSTTGVESVPYVIPVDTLKAPPKPPSPPSRTFVDRPPIIQQRPPHPLAIAALTTGALALPFSCVPCLGMVTVPFSVIGTILGVLGVIFTWGQPEGRPRFAIAALAANVAALAIVGLELAILAHGGGEASFKPPAPMHSHSSHPDTTKTSTRASSKSAR
jgi:serine/threonine protein kinase